MSTDRSRSAPGKSASPTKQASRSDTAKKATAETKHGSSPNEAKQVTAKKATATAKKATAEKPTAKKGTAKRATAKKATAKKATAKKATAKKATATATKATGSDVAKKGTQSETTGVREAKAQTVASDGADSSAPSRSPSSRRRASPAKRARKHAQRAVGAPTSKFFRRAQRRATRLVSDPDALRELGREAGESGSLRSGPFSEVVDDFLVLVRLVIAYSRGHYREVPVESLVLIVAGLLYVLSPVDLIPDVVPVAGYMDDAVVVGFVLKQVRAEVDAFRRWETGH